MPALLARIHSAPVYRGRDPRASPAFPAQCTFPRPTDARRARRDPRRHVRRVEPRLARALPLTTGNLRMISHGLPPALLLAQAGGGTSSLMPLVLQFALIIGIIYFIMIRPQQKQ